MPDPSSELRAAEPSKASPCVDAERPSPRRDPEVLADEGGEMPSSSEQGVVSVLSCAKHMSGFIYISVRA